MTTFEDPVARRERARRVAQRAEMECAAVNGRPDLLLVAARNRLAAGEPEVARAQVEALLERADDTPEYVPRWLLRQARDLLAQIDAGDGPQAQPATPSRR